MAYGDSTQVSKSNATIKKIIAKTVGAWSGRRVSVEQVGRIWNYLLYNDSGEPYVYIASAVGSRAHQVQRPSYGGPATQINAPADNEVVVIKQIGPQGSITIVVPRLDPHQLDVARDALQSKDKKAFAALVLEFGDYAGIAQAVLEAQANTLTKADSRPESDASSRTSSSKRLDREITAFVSRYKG